MSIDYLEDMYYDVSYKCLKYRCVCFLSLDRFYLLISRYLNRIKLFLQKLRIKYLNLAC